MFKTLGRLALASLLLGGLGLQAFALAADAPEKKASKENQKNRETLVSKILAEGKEKKFDCEQLVTKIDTEIIEIDLKLDDGANNEDELLAERQELVSCRLSQPCHAEVVTPVAPCCGHAVEVCQCEQPIEIMEEVVIVDDMLCEEEILYEEEIIGEPMMGGYGGCCGGGGMGGGGGGGGMGWGLAGLAGLAGLVALDDDDPVAVSL